MPVDLENVGNHRYLAGCGVTGFATQAALTNVFLICSGHADLAKPHPKVNFIDNSMDNPNNGDEQAKPSSAILTRLWPYLVKYRGRLFLAFLSLLIAAAVTLTIPVAFRFLIDMGFTADSASKQVNLVFISLFLLAILLALSTAVRFYLVSWLGERITADLRSDVFANVLQQDPRFFESLKTGEVLSRLSTDTTLIQSLVGSSISFGLRNAILFVGSLFMMLYTNLSLASIILGLLLLVVIPIMLFGRRVRKLSQYSQDKLADTGAMAGEILNAMEIVQAYVREPFEITRYRTASDKAFDMAIRRNRMRSTLTAIAIVLIFGALVFVLWLGANAVMQGTLSAGLLTQFVLYAAIVGSSGAATAEIYGDLQRAAGATSRLLQLLEAKPAILSGNASLVERSQTTEPTSAFVEFADVSFSYPSRPNEQALQNISFIAKPGETIALVGPSGAGKSTIIQLMLRFYDPDNGTIKLNNTALHDLEIADLRNHIGLVSQQSIVFSANAMENIRYGNLNATDEEVYQAARDAQADDFIRRLPEGYSTYVGERGMRLSGGQRQRLSIARALLKNPPLLLLDEATSALDTESERKVQMALERAMKGRTTIVIAHRLATIVNADKIIVIADGKIKEVGNHEELISRDGVYAGLAAMQFKPTQINQTR